MKLHSYIKKLFDEQNPWLRREREMAKANQRKARGPATEPVPLSLRHRIHTVFGFVWWRGHRKRGSKNAKGQLLPLNQTDIR